MKILHIANFGFNKQGAHFYCTDRKISAGLIENGHFVYDFSFRDMARMGTVFKTKKLGASWANKEILKIVDNLCPDLVLIGHSDLLNAQTLKDIRNKYPAIKLAFWFVDWLCEDHKVKFVKSMSCVVDAVFCTTGGTLLRQFKNDANKVAYIPNITSSSTENLQQFNCNEYKNDFVFFGTVYKDPEREEFLGFLKTSLLDNIEYYGAFGTQTVYGQDYIDALQKARCGLNLSRKNNIELYSSDRIAQLTGHGLLTFSPKIPGFEALYKSNEIVYFDNIEDLIYKYNFYKENQNLAIEIASNGWKKAHLSFNCKRVAKFMLEVIFDQPFSEEYEWSHEVYA